MFSETEKAESKFPPSPRLLLLGPPWAKALACECHRHRFQQREAEAAFTAAIKYFNRLSGSSE